MNLLLIAGHGGNDPGACSGGYSEAVIARQIVSRLNDLLWDKMSVSIYPTDRDCFTDVNRGACQVDFSVFDYVLEVHLNACRETTFDGKTTGSECFVTAAESGTGVEDAILNNLAGLGFKNRGVKRNNFAVIKRAKAAGASSALLEVCFIDDPDDMTLYTTRPNIVSNAIAAGICEGFGIQYFKNEDSYDVVTDLIPKAEEVKEVTKYYNSIEEIPAGELRDAVDYYSMIGVIKGNGSGLNLSMDMIRLLVFMKRAGV